MRTTTRNASTTLALTMMVVTVVLTSCSQGPVDPVQGSLDQLSEIELPDDESSAEGADEDATVAQRAAAALEVKNRLRRLEECIFDKVGPMDQTLMLSGGPEAEAHNLAATQAMIECEPNLEQVDSVIGPWTGILQAMVGDHVDFTLNKGRCTVRYVLDNSDDPAYTMAIGDRMEDQQVFIDAYEECLTPEEFANTAGGNSTLAYGDDARLDELHDRCADGDLRLCDTLYWSAPAGSDYGAFAADCGGNRPAAMYSCSLEGAVDPATGFADLESAQINDLSASCVDGDMVACDLLFFITPLDSDHNDVGFTCGGRIGIGAYSGCRTQLGDKA